MSSVSNVQSGTTANQNTTLNNSLGKDDFLKILVTQLQNQDPSSPMKDREFISQMAQFTSVEQLTNISNAIQNLQQTSNLSANLIGKQISWMDDQGTDQNGLVDAIILKDGQQFASVNGNNISLDQIEKITE